MLFFEKPQNLFDYYHFHKGLSNSEISNVFKIASQLNPEKAVIGNGDNKKIIEEHRNSNIKWINYSEKTSYLFSLLQNYINIANSNFYNFDIISTQDDIQYTEYYSSKLGKYDWHIDSLSFNTVPYRKLSLTIQLSDPNEYEGGDLEIYYPHPEKAKIIKAPKEKGKIIVFPSYMWHRVTPVTKGVRKSLVWWVGGSPFR